MVASHHPLRRPRHDFDRTSVESFWIDCSEIDLSHRSACAQLSCNLRAPTHEARVYNMTYAVASRHVCAGDRPIRPQHHPGGRVKNAEVDDTGRPTCWSCGSAALKLQRTTRSKLAAGPAALATKRKLKCLTCGVYNDRRFGQRPGDQHQELSEDVRAGQWAVDPTGRHELRWWDGSVWTHHVCDGGQTAVDDGPIILGADASSEVWDQSSGASSAAPASQRSAPSSKAHLGDSILKGVGLITLSTWANNRMARAFMVPELVALVQERPKDPERRLWLGIRLAEMEALTARINKSIGPTSAGGLVTRPVTRAASRAVVGALRSDNTPASRRVLSGTFDLALAYVRKEPASPRALNVLARVYGAAGQYPAAFDVAYASSLADPARSDAFYIAAESLYSAGHIEAAEQWAARASIAGSSLASALQSPQTLKARSWLRSTSGSRRNPPSTERFWRMKAHYYQGATQEELRRYFGPSPLAPQD